MILDPIKLIISITHHTILFDIFSVCKYTVGIMPEWQNTWRGPETRDSFGNIFQGAAVHHGGKISQWEQLEAVAVQWETVGYILPVARKQGKLWARTKDAYNNPKHCLLQAMSSSQRLPPQHRLPSFCNHATVPPTGDQVLKEGHESVADFSLPKPAGRRWLHPSCVFTKSDTLTSQVLFIIV